MRWCIIFEDGKNAGLKVLLYLYHKLYNNVIKTSRDKKLFIESFKLVIFKEKLI